MKRTLIFALLSAATLTSVFCEKKTKVELDMIKIPGKEIEMLRTEVTQELYESVMGENPSWFQLGNKNLWADAREVLKKICGGGDTSKLPMDRVSWYDAIYFCNKLSEMKGLKPVYSVNGETDTSKWDYTPHKEEEIEGKIMQDDKANGFHLPTEEEWEYAALGGQNYKYAGSNNIDEVGWYWDNSNLMGFLQPHPVATKKPNGYNLYDMSGNVSEWVWDSRPDRHGNRCCRGGNYCYDADSCGVSIRDNYSANYQIYYLGFRIVRNTN